MKTIRKEYQPMGTLKKAYKLIFTAVLTFALVILVPGGYENVYAAPLEDCDLDGFDDATGVPVPWPGYDETKGDTPDGPAGSKTPTTTPANADNTSTDTSGKVTPGKTSGEDSESKENTGSSGSDNAGKNNSTKSDSTATSDLGKTNTETSEKKNNTGADKTVKSESGKANSVTSANTKTSATDNTKKVESEKSNTTTKNSAGNTESEKINSTVKDDIAAVESNGTSDITSDTTNSEETENTDSLASGEKTPGNDENQKGDETAEESTESENAYISAADVETVINTKGVLDIRETAGSVIHVGSSIIISGTGFAENIQDLEIQIQSEPRQLGIVESSESGTFQAEFLIPEELEAGIHNIVLLYQGEEITRQEIEIGPKAADSFIKAISVGFTADNKGLFPGLSILLGLSVLGIGTLGVTAFIRPRHSKS